MVAVSGPGAWRPYVAWFVSLALLFGLAFMVLTPPYQGADEPNHLYRAYAISTGVWYPDTTTARRGGQVPESLLAMFDTYQHVRWYAQAKTSFDSLPQFAALPLAPQHTRFVDYPNTAVYPWPVYAPATVGILVARTFNFSTLATLRAARLAGLFTWLAAAAFALWLLPAWRRLFVALLLLPMVVWTHATVSADTLTNSVAVVAMAYLLRLAYGSHQPLRSSHLVGLLLAGVTLATMKLVYVPILLLAVLIPAKRFTNWGGKWLVAAAVAGLTVATLFYWSHQSQAVYLPYEDYAVEFREGLDLPSWAHVPRHQAMIVRAPHRLFRAAGNSLSTAGPMFVQGTIGTFGWLDTYLPIWLVAFGYVYLFALAAMGCPPSWWHKLAILVGVVACYLLVIFSQMLSWEPVGTHIVGTVQGRYLVPFVPLFFLLFTANWRPAGRRWLLPLGSLLLLSASTYIIYQRYYVS